MSYESNQTYRFYSFLIANEKIFQISFLLNHYIRRIPRRNESLRAGLCLRRAGSFSWRLSFKSISRY